MKSGIAAAFAASLLLCVQSASAEPRRTVQEEAAALGKQVKERGCDLKGLNHLAARPDFSQLTDAQRSMTFTLLAICDLDNGLDWSRKATAIPEATSLAWATRFIYAAAVARDRADALQSMERAASLADDGALSFFMDDAVVLFGWEILGQPAEFERYMKALDKIDWRSEDFGASDELWARYSEILTERGDVSGAWRAAKRIVGPTTLAELTLDKRFDSFVALDRKRYDVSAAAQAALEAHRAALSDWASGENLRAVSTDLRSLGRPEEALTLINAWLVRRAAAEDPDLASVENDKAMILRDLGRIDEAITTMRTAAARLDEGRPNVIQTLNLALLLNAAGRPQDALDTLKPFAPGVVDTSAYGWMWVHAERACAHAQLGDAAGLRADLAYTAEHETDDPTAAVKAQLCAGDTAAAAAIYDRWLKDPERRREALFQLSRFQPDQRTANDLKVAAQFDAVRAHAVVKAAVAAVGRTADIPLRGSAVAEFY